MQRNGRLKLFVQNSLIKNDGVYLADTVRDSLKAYWKVNENNIIYNNLLETYTYSTKSIDTDTFKFPGEIAVIDGLTTSVDATNLYGSLFEDYSFNEILPYNAIYPWTVTQQPNTSKIVISNGSNIKSNDYEKFKKNKELFSLNYYIGLGRDIKNNKDIEDLVSLGNSLDDGKLTSLSSNGIYPEAGIYFDEYAKYANQFFTNNQSKYLEKLQNIILDGKTAKLYASPFSLKEAFNSYNQLDIYKEKQKELSQALFETDLNIKLISDLYVNKLFNENKEFSTSEQFLKFVEGNTDVANNLVELSTVYTKKQTINISNIFPWAFQNIVNTEANQQNPEKFFDFSNPKAILIGSEINLEKETTRDNLFLNKLYSRLFYSKLLKLAIDKKYFRTFKDILDGKLCHTEVIGFRIDKYKIDGKINKFISSTYFENNDTEIINYIDTQIALSTKYVYKIYYYTAVFGNLYIYGPKIDTKSAQIVTNNHNDIIVKPTLFSQQIRPNKAEATSKKVSSFIVYNVPSIKILEIDATNNPQLDPRIWPTNTPSVDNTSYPPNTPIVEPVPYFDYRHRTQLKFNFQKVIDNMVIGVPYYGVLNSDKEKIESVINSQKLKYPEDINKDPPQVRFRTQPGKHIYQVFRTTDEPTSYTDFKEVYYTVGTENKNEAELDSYIDNLQPNIDYYYTFRSLEVDTGLFSNPTAVYVIRMIKDSDIYYPVVRTLDLEGLGEKLRKNSLDGQKVFKKYLQIKPNLSKVDDLANKKIKIRVTSKKTGRKIDVDFKFNLSKKE